MRLGEAQTFVIPIRPEFHSLLFPEDANQGELIQGFFSFGNSIRKAYLSHSAMKSLDKGSTVLFYRSHDIKGITSIGVVENTLKSNEPERLTKFVLKRTVYPRQEIEGMCKKPVLAILFRYAGSMRSPITLNELKGSGVLSRAPQSIQSVPKESIEWLREQLKLRLHF
jgi:hypothetical protein